MMMIAHTVEQRRASPASQLAPVVVRSGGDRFGGAAGAGAAQTNCQRRDDRQ
jgi:hypothetical protein